MKVYDPLAQYQQQGIVAPSFLTRMLAFFVDMALLSVTIFAPMSLFAEQFIPTADYKTAYQYFLSNAAAANVLTIVFFFMFVLAILYFTLLEYLIGQTAGKRLLLLKVVDISGKHPAFWQCIVRNLVLLPVFPFVIFWVVDPLYLLFTKQRLTEQLSRTRTVNYINNNIPWKEKL